MCLHNQDELTFLLAVELYKHHNINLYFLILFQKIQTHQEIFYIYNYNNHHKKLISEHYSNIEIQVVL